MKTAIVVTVTFMGFLCFWLAAICTSIYGLYLAFSASIVLGVVVLLLEPSPLILGLVALCGNPDVAQRIATWLGL